MKRSILPLVILALGASFTAQAQVKDKVKKEKETDLIIRKKGDGKEKMTIVIDGNDITVNGKPLDELKEGDVEVLREKGLTAISPRLNGLTRLRGGVKMFGNDNSNPAYLGVTSKASDKGAQIVSVQEKSPAEKAGLKKDDIITKVNNKTVESSGELYDAIGQYKPGEKVKITYLRDGKESVSEIVLEKNTNELRGLNFGNGELGQNFNFDLGDLKDLRKLEGLGNMEGLQNLPRFRQDFGPGFSFNTLRKPRLGIQIQDVEEGKGVKVNDVDEDTPAAKAGLKKDDVITSIDGKSIDSVDELQTAIRGMKEGDSFKLGYKRNGQSATADVKFPKKLKTAEL